MNSLWIHLHWYPISSTISSMPFVIFLVVFFLNLKNFFYREFIPFYWSWRISSGPTEVSALYWRHPGGGWSRFAGLLSSIFKYFCRDYIWFGHILDDFTDYSWQQSQDWGKKTHHPKLSSSHCMLNDPEWILKAKACDTETVVDEGKCKIQENWQHQGCPVDDGLEWKIILNPFLMDKTKVENQLSSFLVNLLFSLPIARFAIFYNYRFEESNFCFVNKKVRNKNGWKLKIRTYPRFGFNCLM